MTDEAVETAEERAEAHDRVCLWKERAEQWKETAHQEANNRDFWKRLAQETEQHILQLETENDRLRAAMQHLLIYVRAYPSIPDLAVQVDKRITQALGEEAKT